MASESEQGHVDCTVKRRTRLVRITFVGSSVQSLTNSNRRIRNRTYGGVGGADERLSPLSRSTQNDGLPYGVLSPTASVSFRFDGNQPLVVGKLSRIVAGIARVAVLLRVVGDRLPQRSQRQVRERVGLHKAPNLFYAAVRRNQFALVRRVDAVEARRHRRRARDAQMHFPGSSLAYHANNLKIGRAAGR